MCAHKAVAPFVEELFFRGLLYPALKRSLRFVPALLLTSALFGLLHSFEWAFAWGPILIIFFVGVAITLVREYMDSLAASWIVHMVYNGSLLALQIISTHGFTQN